MAMIAAANMDPAANACPEKLDLAAQAQPAHRLRHRHSLLPGPSARAHRGQARAARAVRPLAEARAGGRPLRDPLAQAPRAAGARGVAGGKRLKLLMVARTQRPFHHEGRHEDRSEQPDMQHG